MKTGLLILREHKLGVFENRMLRRLPGPKRDEVTRDWIKLHNDDGMGTKDRTHEWGDVACTGEMIKAYKILDEKPEGKRPLGRHMQELY